MSFNSYCRECAIHLSSPTAKDSHVHIVHFGVAPPDPEISEQLFYTIKANDMRVRAKTCPFCLVYFDCIGTCVSHVTARHPQHSAVFQPAHNATLLEWERLVESAFPGFLWAHSANDRPRSISRSSSESSNGSREENSHVCYDEEYYDYLTL
ncbi:hypothetical protein B9Z55_028199 [Caenorhabditis nigoni]|uniref:C2H2-type domain-containing protein n=1 Tax=Caenorhabditis nigoni TaxID=1611254 RepID=A0A2G5SCS6_9PELO|nr:hypothetical protein B9Z55_028199 [Caenorhabditis nigoni]